MWAGSYFILKVCHTIKVKKNVTTTSHVSRTPSLLQLMTLPIQLNTSFLNQILLVCLKFLIDCQEKVSKNVSLWWCFQSTLFIWPSNMLPSQNTVWSLTLGNRIYAREISALVQIVLANTEHNIIFKESSVLDPDVQDLSLIHI